MSHEEALSKAHAERMRGKSSHSYMIKRKPVVALSFDERMILKAKQIPKNDFPDLKYVADKYKPILKDIIANVISNKGELKMNPDGFAVGIEHYSRWKSFCFEFVDHQKAILKYFEATGSFKIQTIGQAWILKYQ